MPISLDDMARLPGLTPYDEVAERQRLADMKAFRQYLVETGTVQSLVKMYQHTAKNEMRLDNPNILNEFITNYVVDTAETQEIERLTGENASLAVRGEELQSQVESLERGLAQQQRLEVGKALWRHLVSPDFWEGDLDDTARATGLPLNLLYRRLCGAKVDKASGKVLVNLLRPASHDNLEALSMPRDSFSAWIATGIPEDLHEWCRDELLPRLSAVPVPNEAPYERDLLQEIRNSPLYREAVTKYPDSLNDVGHLISLEQNLISFLDAAAAFRF